MGEELTISSLSKVHRTTIILTSPSNWDEWVEIIKTKAEAEKVWDFVDPSIATENLKSLTQPEVPKPVNVNPEKNTVAELSSDELDKLKLLHFNFKHQLQLYE
jgi:hypothetical protein